MKIAFCSKGCDLEAQVDERFGRADFFLIYNKETGEYTSVENMAKEAKGGAGALAVQQLVDNEVSVVIAPEAGPQALEALKNFNITVYSQNGAKTVQEALNLWSDEKLDPIEEPGKKGLHKV